MKNRAIILFICGFLSFIYFSTTLNAADFEVDYANLSMSGVGYVTPGSWSFKVFGMPNGYSCKWYVNSAYTGQTDNTSLLVRSSTYSRTFNQCDAVTAVQGRVYNSSNGGGTLIGTVTWNITVEKPDLIISSCSISGSTTFNPGESLTVNWTIKNQGGMVADFPVTQLSGLHFYLSDNNSFGTGDILLATQNINDFADGESRTGSKTVTIPSTTSCGTRYIILYVDFDDDVEECTNEGNNTNYTQISVGTFSIDPTGITGTGTICLGSSVTLYVSGGSLAPGATWKWYSGGSCGGSSIGSGSSITVSPSSTTTYSVQAEGGTCNITTTCVSKTVTVNTVPSTTSVSGGGTSCNSATLTASGGSGGTIYWQGTTNNGTSTATPSTSQTVTSPGTYYFRAYNSCGWGTQGSASVTVTTAPSAVTVNGGGTFCSSEVLTASGGSGGTIYWQGTTSNGTSTATPSTSQTVTSSGTYYFRAYNSCGWGVQGSATVTINPLPTTTIVSGGGTSCNSATLTASGGSGGTIYWQGTTSNGTSTTAPLTSQTVSTSGTYYFRSYNSCGWGTQGSATVTISAVPAATSVSGGGTYCNSTILTSSGGGGGTIYWQGTTSGGTSTATPSTSQTVATSGTYYFRSYNSCGWGTQGSATVTINPAPTAPTGQATQDFCIFNFPQVSNLVASGIAGSTIKWYANSNGGTPLNATTSLVNGTHYFASQTTSNGCESTSRLNVLATISPCTGIESNKVFNGISVYPNPANEKLTIVNTKSTGPVNFDIVNSNGKVIYNSVLNNICILSLSQFTSGIYFIRLTDGNTYYLLKFIKE